MFRPRALAASLKFGAWGWPILIIVSAAVIAWRCHEFLVNPYLRAEDGAKVFAYFYDHREVKALFRVKSGYTPFLPNLLGWLSVRLPARSTPYFLTAAPALLAAFTFSLPGAPSYRRYVPSDSVRAALCLTLLVAPMGGQMLICNTDYSIWNALLCLMLLVLLPVPHAKFAAFLFVSLLAILIWTHPLSIAALPATLVWFWRDKGRLRRALHGALALCQGAHIWLGTRPQNATFAKGDGPVHRLGELLHNTLEHLARDVIPAAIFPWRSGSASSDYALSCSFALAMLACAVLPKHHRVASRTFYAWVGYAIVVPMALVVFSRAERGIVSQRYLYVPRGFVMIGMCVVLSQLVLSVASWSAKLARLGALLPALTSLSYFAEVSSVTGRLVAFEQPDPDNGRIVAKFFSDLALAERKQGGHCNIYLRCKKRHGDWPFMVDTRQNCSEKG